jgi:hypothetical protein
MDSTWETDDTDEDTETLPDAFSGFRKGFLLGKTPDRIEPKRLIKPTDAQNASQYASETQAQAKHIQDNIFKEIQYLRHTYGDSPGETSMPIPYAEANELFQKIEAWTRQIRVSDACERVEKAAKIIEEAADKLQSGQVQSGQVASYAQAARKGNIRESQGLAPDAPLRIHPKEEKRVTVKILNKAEARELKEQSKEHIVGRIQQAAGGNTAGHKVLAVRQLRSGDLVVHIDSPAGKKEMESQKSWAEAIAPSAVVRKRTWPVIVHGVRVKDHQLEAWEKHAKSIVKENAKSVPNLRIRGIRWLRRTNKKEFALLVIEVDSAEQANRLITEGVVIGYDLKLTERYDASYRIT